MNFLFRTTTLIIFILLLYNAQPLNASDHAVDEITVYNAAGEITAVPGKLSAAVIAVEIPEDSYIYANPKGEGIGKATEILVQQNSVIKYQEVRYPAGDTHHAKGDPDPVNIYKKIVRFPFAFEVKSNVPAGDYLLKADVSILMCSTDACVPVERIVEIPFRVRRGIPGNYPLVMNHLSEFLSLKKNAAENNVPGNKPAGELTAAGTDGFSANIIFTPEYPDGEITGFIEAIIFGLIAGFILNFMPCVLPVVSLKIMSFVMNAGEKKKVIVIQGILFSAGIIVSFLVLAALAAFFGYKWGALFQNRFFIIAMTSFVFVMALSLLGIFTINAPLSAGRVVSKSRGIYRDAFVKGIVATLLATPCSGPFLGGTLAWALTRPPEIIFMIFLSVGAGMALPYMLLALNPSLLRFLPKPGVWMNYFEKAMGFLLMFTVVYLLGIADDSGRMGLVLFLLILSIGLWQYGLFGSVDKGKKMRVISLIILLAVAALGYCLSFKYFFQEREYSHERISFSPERITANRDNGIITVLEFTADWCPNCSLVEKIALEKDEVQKLFDREDIEFMVADITQKNPQGESLMNRLGSKSIPLLAVFPPGEGFTSPFCLRDIYSADEVVAAIIKADKFKKRK